MQLVDKQIPKFDERFISAVFPITTMNPHPTTTFRGCYGPNLHSTEGRRQRSRNDQYIIGYSLPLIPSAHSTISLIEVETVSREILVSTYKVLRESDSSSDHLCSYFDFYRTHVRYKHHTLQRPAFY